MTDNAQLKVSVLVDDLRAILGKDVNDALNEAARKADLPRLRLALAAGADVNAKTRAHWTALHNAASYPLPAAPQAVQLLLDAGADHTATNRNGVTALELAQGWARIFPQASFGETVKVLELATEKNILELQNWGNHTDPGLGAVSLQEAFDLAMEEIGFCVRVDLTNARHQSLLVGVREYVPDQSIILFENRWQSYAYVVAQKFDDVVGTLAGCGYSFVEINRGQPLSHRVINTSHYVVG